MCRGKIHTLCGAEKAMKAGREVAQGVKTCAFMLRHFSHARLLATLWTVARQAPLVHGILQARVLEWVAVSFSRGSSQLGIKPRSPTLKVDSLPDESHKERPPYWLSTLLNIFQIIFMETLQLHESYCFFIEMEINAWSVEEMRSQAY